jgi:hypothetical protein
LSDKLGIAEEMSAQEGQEKKRGLLKLLVDLIDRPAITLKYVGEKTGWLWLAPALLILLGLVVRGVATAPQAAELAAREIQRSMLDMPPDQAEAIGQQMATFSSPAMIAIFAVVGGVFMLALLWIIGAGTLYTLALFLGGESGFKQMFTLMAWTWLPFFLRDLTQTVYVALSGQMIADAGLSGLVATGDRALDGANLLYSFLSQLEPFFVWHLILVAVGLAVVNRFGRTKAVVAGLVYGAVMVGIALAPTLIGSLFS